MRFMESRNAKFLENDLISGSGQFQNTISEREQPSTSNDRLVIVQNTPQVQTGVVQPITEDPQLIADDPTDQVVHEEPEMVEQPAGQHNP